MTGRASTIVDIMLLVAGFAVWSSAFVTLYGLNGLGCAFGWDGMAIGPFSALRVGIIALWLVHMAGAALLLFWTWRRRQAAADMFATGAFALSVGALIATAGIGAPALILSMCR